jgi:hypothetical protein
VILKRLSDNIYDYLEYVLIIKLFNDVVSASELIYYCSVYKRCYAMTARWADITGTFLGNGSVNTFP